jgi:hypothetical protein
MELIFKNYSDKKDQEDNENENKKNKDNINNNYNNINIRNVPHIEGNFSTHIYLEVKYSKKIKNYVNEIINIFSKTNNEWINKIQIIKELHISLSKNFFLKYHQINNFTTKFKKAFSSYPFNQEFSLVLLSNLKYLSNEFNNRYFLCVEILKTKSLKRIIDNANNILNEFKIENYFESKIIYIKKEFLPHISVISSPDNFASIIEAEELTKVLKKKDDDNQVLKILKIKYLCLKIGSNLLRISLKTN